MKIFVQRIGDQRFYAAPDKWVADAQLALDFENTARAVQFVTGADLRGVQIILRFKNQQPDAAIQLAQRPG